MKLLAHRHRNGVLHLGASHLHDLDERVGFHAERSNELLQFANQPIVAKQEGDLERSRIRVVG